MEYWVKNRKSIFHKNQRVRFAVIPAKAGIQYFKYLKILWTPVFTGVTTF
jgi:hypothetical protein